MSKDEKRIYRVIDANANRACEGLRAAEDALRFIRDDAGASAAFRRLRHDIRAAASSLPGGERALIAARDSQSDAARNAAPRSLQDAPALYRSNMARAQEALRSLEEFAKLLSPAAASAFGELRFRIYDLEKNTAGLLDAASRRAMPQAPFLYAVADYETLRRGRVPFAFLRSITRAGVKIVQLREKGGNDRELLDMARRTADAAADTGALFFVNDRVDIAIAAGAHGVHLGEEDLPLVHARDIAGSGLLIGVSTHTFRDAKAAGAANPDYVAIGPIFRSPTKDVRAPLGTEILARACAAVVPPVVAIGGITEANAASVAAAGAAGAAVVSALAAAKDPAGAVKRLMELLNDNHAKR